MQFLQTEPGAEPVIAEAIFPAPPARVFRAWTEPREIEKWFGVSPGGLVSAETDLRIGGQWRFVLNEGAKRRSILEGEYTAIEQDALLQFTWSHVEQRADGSRDETPKSTVTIRFEAQGAATSLHLRHEGILREDGRKGVGTGWEATFGHLHDLLARAD